MQTAAIAYRVADFLKHHPPFQGMEEQDLLGLVSRGRVKFHEIDEFLCWQGSAFAPFLFVIQQGSVSLWSENGGKELLRDIRGPGDVIGLERFLDAKAYACSAKANADVVVYALPAADFQPLLSKYPSAARYVDGQAAPGAIYRESGKTGVHQTFVAELARHPEPLWCPPTASVAEAARRLHEGRAGHIAVMQDHELLGTVDSGGVLGWIAAGGTPQQSVDHLMRRVPPTVAPGTLVSECVLAMSRADSPVVALTADGTRSGGLLRLVSREDLQPAFGDNPLALLQEIARASDREVLHVLHARARAFLQVQLADPSTIDWLTALSEHLNIAVARRLVELNGDDTAGLSWCFYGAAGRGELLTAVSPEIAVICSDASGISAAREAWERLRSGLVDCGYLAHATPECGEELLCAPASGWIERFTEWAGNPIVSRMYAARPLFDLRLAFGHGALWEAVEASVRAALAARPNFVKLLANDCLSSLPPLTFVQDAVVDSSGAQSEVFELQQCALDPLVELGRVFGVANGQSLGASTLERLGQARSRLAAHESVFREAIEALRVLLYLQARTGLRLQGAGAEVAPAQLSRFDRQALKSGFRAIQALLDFTAQRYLERQA